MNIQSLRSTPKHPHSSIPLGILIVGTLFTSAYPKADVSRTQERAPLALGQQEQRILKIDGLTRYSLGSDILRGHRLSENSLLLKGLTPGNSDLWIWKEDGSSEHRTVTVEKWGAAHHDPGFARALSHLEEIEIIQSGNGVTLRGEVQTVAELARITAFYRAFPKQVTDETRVADSLLREGEITLKNWLESSYPSSQLRIERRGQSLWLRGPLQKPIDRDPIEKQARALFPALLFELDSFPDSAPTVHFRVFLLEIRKSRFHSLGIGWPSEQTNVFKITSSSIREALELDLAIQALEGEGAAKILSNPELVVRAPGEAELFAGGELPIRMRSRSSSQITWKPYGLTLKLKVNQTVGDRVRLDISTEVSQLNPQVSEDPIPGIQANRIKTQVDARFGQPLFLSGLLQEGTRENARGLPLLKQIPVLGALFSSEDYLSERSELVAILLPSSAPPPAPMARVTPQQTRLPKGWTPIARNTLTAEQERTLKESKEYPWNALQ